MAQSRTFTNSILLYVYLCPLSILALFNSTFFMPSLTFYVFYFIFHFAFLLDDSTQSKQICETPGLREIALCLNLLQYDRFRTFYVYKENRAKISNSSNFDSKQSNFQNLNPGVPSGITTDPCQTRGANCITYFAKREKKKRHQLRNPLWRNGYGAASFLSTQYNDKNRQVSAKEPVDFVCLIIEAQRAQQFFRQDMK
ncbi:MAG: hypothetical protein HDT37_05245 [Clostridiales bacterium]|nr:hypothetical protein [Clostridiales bacterium]